VPDARTLARRLLGLALALATMAGISALAHLPVGAEPEHAALRLALRTRSARIEVCRDRSPEELAELPAHLRQARVCDERPVDYRLTLAVDGATLLERTVTHRGIRHTRPLTVDELLELAPGAHRIEARFAPVIDGDPPPTPAQLAELPDATLERTVELTAGRILLVVLDEAGDLTFAGGG